MPDEERERINEVLSKDHATKANFICRLLHSQEDEPELIDSLINELQAIKNKKRIQR